MTIEAFTIVTHCSIEFRSISIDEKCSGGVEKLRMMILVVPLQLILSVLIMLRGHNEPEGGFIGVLAAAAAIVLWGVAYGMDKARKIISFPTQCFMATGLLCAALSGIIALFLGPSYMTGMWEGAVETLSVDKLKCVNDNL